MRAFIDVIYDLLNGEKKAGGKLEQVKSLVKDPTWQPAADDYPIVVIKLPKDRLLVSRTEGYKMWEVMAGIYVAEKYSARNRDYETAEALVETIAQGVIDTLLADPALVTAAYPQGFSSRDEATGFSDIETGPDVINGVSVAVSRLPFKTETLQRFGAAGS